MLSEEVVATNLQVLGMAWWALNLWSLALEGNMLKDHFICDKQAVAF